MECFINYPMCDVLIMAITIVRDEYRSRNGCNEGVDMLRFHSPRGHIILNMNLKAVHKAL